MYECASGAGLDSASVCLLWKTGASPNEPLPVLPGGGTASSIVGESQQERATGSATRADIHAAGGRDLLFFGRL